MKERTNKLFSLLISAILVAQPLLANGVIAWAETDLSPATTVSTSTETSESETSSTEEGQEGPADLEGGLDSSDKQNEEQNLAKSSQVEPEKAPVLPSHLLAMLPLDSQGDILLSYYQEAANQVALVGKDGSVSKVPLSDSYGYTPINPKAQDQFEQVRSAFEAIQFEDLYEYLVPAYQSNIERLRIQTELQKTLGRTPTSAEVDTALRAYYMERLDLRTAFDEVKGQLPWLLMGILERTESVDINQLLAQKKRILLGLTYLERQYSFDFDHISAKRLLLFYPEVFGTPGGSNPLDRIVAIGQVSYADLELLNAEKTFEKFLSVYIQQGSLQAWLDQTVASFAPAYDGASWFNLTSPAHIVETVSHHGETRIYEKMRTDERLRKHLIALLTVSPDSIFAISTMSSVNYGLVQSYVPPGDTSALPAFKEQLQAIAQQQEDFFATWARITGKSQELASANILVVDSLRHYGSPYQSARELWSAATGPTANLGVKEFFTPLSLYRPYQQVGAEAAPSSRSFHNFMVKSLSQSGQETFTHEVTHIIDKSIYFMGQDRRTGQLAEVYARGMFETIDNSVGVSAYKPVFNLNLSYELGDQRTQNASSSRFQSAADLQTYMQGVMDVLYTLDYAEAKASLGKSAEDKALLYHQLTLVPDSNVARRGANQVKDKIQTITSSQAAQLTTLNHLIEQGMISSRFTFQGTTGIGLVEPNSYYVIQLFNPIYAAMQNDPGSVGELSFKRNAYELLAEYGYQDGMVAYISNQYGGSDQAALAAIFGGQYQGQMVEFKKAMFQRRIEKRHQLKAIDGIQSYQELEALMQVAVDQDLAKMKQNKAANRPVLDGVTAVESLKLRVYQAYLKLSNDFSEPIYQPILGTKTEEIIVPIPIQRVEQSKADLWEGETQEVPGQEGSKKLVKTWQTQDGVPVGQPEIVETEIRPMRPTIVYRGTKPVQGETVATRIVTIPIETEYRTDANLDEGKTRTVDGKAGSKRVITTQPTYKGQPQGQATVREEIITPMVKTIIYRGTKPVQGEIVTTRIVTIPIETEYRTDANLDEGKTRTVDGKAGSKRVITTQPTYKGQPQGQTTVREEIITPMVKTIIYRGTKPVAKYKVSYQFTSTDKTRLLPQEVINLLPKDSGLYAKGQVVTAKTPSKTSIPLSEGTWTFAGYSLARQTITDKDIRFVGQWRFTKRSVQIGTKTEESIVPIPIQRVEQSKADLWEGETQEVPGQEGSKKVVKTWQTQDGVPVGQPEIVETEIRPMRPTIVYRGTKPVQGETVATRIVTIPIETEYRTDANLDEGKTRTVDGKAGSKRVITTQPTYKGQPQGQATVREEIITPMVKTIIYRGTKPVAKYKVSYQFTSTDKTRLLPQEVINLLPKDSGLYARGQVVTAKTPSKTSIALSEGTWTFAGYSLGRQTITDKDIRFVGQWRFTAKPQVVDSVPDLLKPVYRLYHPSLQVHLYTTDANELAVLKKRGDWNYEGIAWKTETTKGDPVYRLYHPTIKVHLYTRDKNEYAVLAQRGWLQEGIAYRFYGPVPVYRLYHTGLKKHLYTRDRNERDLLKTRGWLFEGIAWYSQP